MASSQSNHVSQREGRSIKNNGGAMNHKNPMYINNEQPKSIDEATPEEWDALHRAMAIDSDSETGNENKAIPEPRLTPSQQAQLDSICFECG